MEIFGGIIGVVLVAILISAVFYYAFRVRGPWGSFWTFFLVLLLSIWAASLWVQPVGPVYYGISWIPTLFVGLIIAFLLAAVPTEKPHRRQEKMQNPKGTNREEEIDLAPQTKEDDQDMNRKAATVSGIFWIFMIILLLVVIFGYAL